MTFRRRPGFTLIELLVVIAIISLLMAITVSAVFRLKTAQMEKNTVTTVRKIDIGFMQQWKAALDAIRKEPVPQDVLEFTKSTNGQYDLVRAKALHMKLRIRQEFPQNFKEVYANNSVPLGSGVYATKATSIYALAVLDASAFNDQENAAMLYLIMSQGRGGVTFGNDNAAPTKVFDFPRANGGTVQLRAFVDEWGMPICFRREADDDILPLLQELNAPPFVTPAQLASGHCDPMDPEGRLSGGWPTQNYNLAAGWFIQSNPNNRPYITQPFSNINRGPYVFSSGRDKGFYIPNEQDNIYSFRIQQSGRGN